MLKRFLVLACALVLFVSAFFIHQWWSDAQIEGRFRAERDKFHVDGQDLVTANPPVSEPLTPTAPPMPVVSTGSGDSTVPAPVPAAPPTGTNAPADVPLDSNTLIGPMPPPAPASNPGDTTAPATPATNSPDSTFIYPGLRQLPLVLLGSYRLPVLRVQETGTSGAPLAVPAPPASNAPAALPLTGTNGTTGTNSAVEKSAPADTNAVTKAEPVTERKASKSAVSAIILGFHQFTPPGVRAAPKFMWTMPEDVFAGEMKYLYDNHFNVVPLSDVVAFAKGEKTLPPNTVAITIDDGYKSAIVHAAPILKKYNFPWTFFVYPAFITRTESKGAASWPDLLELGKEGVDVECHSMTHPNLKSPLQKWPASAVHAHHLTPEEYDAFLSEETSGAKAILEKELGKTIKYFAYPFGNYNSQVEAHAVAAGYEAIFTVAGNPIHPGSPLHAMGRYIITTPVEKLFTAYLNQRSLVLAGITPAPGTTVVDPRPVISAVLRYAGTINPDSINAEVSGMGEVKCDFDAKTSMLRLYLPRDLVAPTILVDVHAKDAESGHVLVASWRFEYQATAAGVAHKPIGATTKTNAAAVAPSSGPEPVRLEMAPPSTGSNSAPVAGPSAVSAPEATQTLATPPPGTAAPAPAFHGASAAPAEAATVTNAAPTTP